MIELDCRRQKIFFQTYGATSVRREGKRDGGLDKAYMFTKGSAEAELVIAAAPTGGGSDQPVFYRPFGVPELWTREKDSLKVSVFEDGDHAPSLVSRFLPGLDLALIAEWADYPNTSEVLDRFEAAPDPK